MKCELCRKEIKETFLKKPVGTYIKDKRGKKHIVCNNCQTIGKEEILKKL